MDVLVKNTRKWVLGVSIMTGMSVQALASLLFILDLHILINFRVYGSVDKAVVLG